MRARDLTPLPEDGKPNVPVERPRFRRVFGALSFPGAVDSVPGAGCVDVGSFVASHNGPTPTSRMSSAELLDMALSQVQRAMHVDERKQVSAILVGIDLLNSALERFEEESK